MENTFTFFLVRNELKTTLICTLVCLASLQRVKRFFLEVAIFFSLTKQRAAVLSNFKVKAVHYFMNKALMSHPFDVYSRQD